MHLRLQHRDFVVIVGVCRWLVVQLIFVIVLQYQINCCLNLRMRRELRLPYRASLLLRGEYTQRKIQ